MNDKKSVADHLRDLADAIDTGRVPIPNVQVHWHTDSDGQHHMAPVVATWPGDWKALGNGKVAWAAQEFEQFERIVFLDWSPDDDTDLSTLRAAAALKDAGHERLVEMSDA